MVGARFLTLKWQLIDKEGEEGPMLCISLSYQYEFMVSLISVLVDADRNTDVCMYMS